MKNMAMKFITNTKTMIKLKKLKLYWSDTMQFLKKNFKYIFIFLFSFFCMSFFLTFFDGDVLWNYGFSYAISRNEIPYLNFNMILTPLYSILMSFILRINTNIILFYIENSVIITLIFFLLFKMIDYKAWLFLILLVFPIPALIFPSYNIFLLFLFLLLIYFEQQHKNDYLIGFIIGLAILTKQTVGCALIIPSLIFYHKNINKILKRILGIFLPCFIFLVYLLVTKSLKSFLDLCLFGLFDFTSQNNSQLNLSLIIGLLLIFITFYLYLKNKNQINYLYVLCFSTIIIPLFDYSHLEYFFFAFLILLVDKIKLNKKQLFFNSLLFSSAFTLIFFFFTTFQGKITYPNNYHNFNFRLLYDKNNENYIRNEVIKYIKTNQDKDIVFLASDAYFYKITCNMDINYFDLINKGNHGYNGTSKMKKELSKLKKGTILIIDENETFSKRSNVSIQFNRELAKYGIKISKKITSIGGYGIYEKI